MTEIVLKQAPVISHELQKVGADLTKRINDLNIDQLVATIDTVASLKSLRAELNKELEGFEEQRKAIGAAINEPVKAFKEIYEAEVSVKYKEAVSKLKTKIAEVENQVKTDKKEAVIFYFNELCSSENIDFIKFEQLELDINLSTTLKAYKEKCNAFITGVSGDLALIKTEEHEAEIMVEFKKDLKASKAITTIRQRKENERQEAERIRLKEQERRKAKLLSIAIVYHSTTNVYSFNDAIYVSEDKVSKATKEEFEDIFISLEAKIKTFNQEKIKKAVPTNEPAQKIETQKPKEEPAPKLNPPKPEPKEELEIMTASFEAKATLPQLKALGQYMKDNKIIYKNID